MVRGFYNLASGMLTKDRQISVISNNIANMKTPGFKKDTMTDHTFGDMYLFRVNGQINQIGSYSFIRSPDNTVTDYSQGVMEETERPLDFGIEGNGFFAVQGENGVVYTRNGSFNLDDDGYLVLRQVGRVLDPDGQPIQLGTDRIQADEQGNLSTEDGVRMGSIGVYDFAEYQDLRTVGEGMYAGGNAVNVQQPFLQWKNVESSNVDLAREMTDTLDAQRTLQNCSAALKMYDQLLNRAVTEIAKI